MRLVNPNVAGYVFQIGCPWIAVLNRLKDSGMALQCSVSTPNDRRCKSIDISSRLSEWWDSLWPIPRGRDVQAMAEGYPLVLSLIWITPAIEEAGRSGEAAETLTITALCSLERIPPSKYHGPDEADGFRCHQMNCLRLLHRIEPNIRV